MSNYSREKSRYGGYIGAIQIHTSIGLGPDPQSAQFNNILPAGFLRCNGQIFNVKDYYALAQVLGIGEQCRFKKENTTLRNPDLTQNDLGQFQLPDLGSKVIIPSLGTGDYINDFVESTGQSKVGPEIEVVSNRGNVIDVNFIGNFRGRAQTNIRLNSNPSYSMPSRLTETALNIENFQSHAHLSTQTYLNYSATHAVGGSGKTGGNLPANSGAGMTLETSTFNATGESFHNHTVGRPISYSHNFAYSFNNFAISADGVRSTLDITLSKDKKLDQVVSPFILVEYIIKY
jgi:hypothetical protein